MSVRLAASSSLRRATSFSATTSVVATGTRTTKIRPLLTCTERISSTTNREANLGSSASAPSIPLCFVSNKRVVSSLGGAAAASRRNLSSSASATASEDYTSPLKELFDSMERNEQPGLPDCFSQLDNDDDDIEHKAASKRLSCGIRESDLRFTTTCYGRLLMAPHVHPNEHRVTLRVSTDNLPFPTTSVEFEILKEIVGKRANEERNELRLNSNQFGSRIENKRHLVSMLDRIVLSCQRLAKELEDGNNDSNNKSKDEKM